MTAADLTAPDLTVAPRRGRAALAWAAIAAGVVAAAIGVAAIAGIGTMPAMGLLDPDAAGPDGSRAVTQLLRDRGVQVEVVRDRPSALAALQRGERTLAITATAPLDDDDLDGLIAAASDVVALEPRSRDLRVLFGDAASAGFADATVTADCSLPIAEAAGTATPGEVFTPGDATAACFPSGDGFGLLVGPHPEAADGIVAAFDATAIATNEHLADEGHAALALNLLGRTGTVVWYVPSFGDGSMPVAPSLGELTPPWVTPAIVVLAISAVAAAIWRGRRFGPLVAENLPVTVRQSETTEGRARLYASAADPVHALDQLRRDALVRIARLLGLGATSDAGAIADAAAARLSADRGRVRGILLDDLPRTDRDLVDAADRLREVEAAVRLSVRPERNPS